MAPEESLDIATARLKGSDWNWRLRIDPIGLYRWYLSGRVAMNIKGTSRRAAESALVRFVRRTMRGELEITPA